MARLLRARVCGFPIAAPHFTPGRSAKRRHCAAKLKYSLPLTRARARAYFRLLISVYKAIVCMAPFFSPARRPFTSARAARNSSEERRDSRRRFFSLFLSYNRPRVHALCSWDYQGRACVCTYTYTTF